MAPGRDPQDPDALKLRPDERELLERHCPRLRYDRQFDYRAISAASIIENEGNLLRRWDGEVIARHGGEGEAPLSWTTLSDYPPGYRPLSDDHLVEAPDFTGDARRMHRNPAFADRIYGRVVRGRGRIWLQYWFWLYFNPKNLLGYGTHQGDWEMIQVGLNPERRPEVATYAQHTFAQSRKWREVEHYPAPDGPHPVVYTAILSHASYFTPGTHPYPTGIDHTYWPQAGRLEGPAVTPQIEEFGPWVFWPGHWGDLARPGHWGEMTPVVLRRLGNGPRSPAQQGAKWDSPNAFHRRARTRALSRLLGDALHRLGALTFPEQPEIEAELKGKRVTVTYRLPQTVLRRARHLNLTIHTGDEQHILASRVVRVAKPQGLETLILDDAPTECVALASSFNRFRQRSNVGPATATA